jgi:hypothetical protein
VTSYRIGLGGAAVKCADAQGHRPLRETMRDPQPADGRQPGDHWDPSRRTGVDQSTSSVR